LEFLRQFTHLHRTCLLDPLEFRVARLERRRWR